MRGVAFLVGKLVLSLCVLSVVAFAATNVLPGDVARASLGKDATQEQLREFRIQNGLDRPAVTRYHVWASDFVRGDWGTSFQTLQPVRDQVLPRLTKSIILAFIAAVVALPLSIGIGLWAGARAGSRADVGVSSATLMLGALPEFVIGVLLLVTVAVKLGWLPIVSGDSLAFGSSFVDRGKAYVLPALTLALTLIPYATRMMRANTREVLAEPHVRAAKLRGVGERSLLFRHVLPNAAPPTVNVLAINLADLIGGLVVVEVVFSFPGAGQLLVQSIGAKDYPTILALTMVIGFGFVLLNTLADFTVLAMTPKRRYAAR